MYVKQNISFIFVQKYLKIFFMNADAETLDLIHWNTELHDVLVLEHKKVLREDNHFEPLLETISIENGLDDLKKGKVRSHSQVKKRYEKWL